MTQALYIYGFASATLQTELEKLCAQLTDIQLLCNSLLIAIYRIVTAEEFTGEQAEVQLQDPHWILPRVQHHEAIVAQVMSISALFPARFATLYSGYPALERFMHKNQYTISRFLQYIAGQQEWAVKGILDKKTAMAYWVSLQPVDIQSAPSKGKLYFQKRKLYLQSEQQLPQWLQYLCDAQLVQLMPFASNLRQRPVIAQSKQQCIINWAFLLPTKYVSAFKQKLIDINTVLQPTGLHFEHSGPWAAYSFSQNIEIEH